MIMKFDGNDFLPMDGMSVREALGENEKKLEDYLKKAIGNLVFPEYLVIGNERRYQREADLFALNESGDLILFELKVDGKYDRGKVYQAMEYAHLFSGWQYSDLNNHYRKCLGSDRELIDVFEQHFGHKIPLSAFNTKQKIVVISNGSSLTTHSAVSYWSEQGVDIREIYYRFYEAGDNKWYLELSNEMVERLSPANGVWINTCSRFIADAYLDMVKNSKASVYGDLCGMIGESFAKTTVFLYHNGYGIIAVGTGTAKITNRLFNNMFDEDENSIALNNFIHGVDLESGKIERPVTPARIRELSERNLGFPVITRAKVVLTEDETRLLLEECRKTFVR